MAERLTRSRRSSSIKTYESKWAIYRSWCAAKNHSSSNPSINNIAKFLVFLWREKRLALSTIKGFRSMLSAAYKFCLPGIGSDPVLQGVIKSFEVERPRVINFYPSWDLDKVLADLVSD